MRLRSKPGKIAAGVDHRNLHAACSQAFHGAVDGVALGDAAEVDLDCGMLKSNAVVGEQCDRAGPRRIGGRRLRRPVMLRQQTDLLQRRGDGDIERAGRAPIEINRVIIQKGIDKEVVFYWYQSHRRVVASEYWGKIYTVLDSVRYNRTDAALVRVTTPLSQRTQTSTH